MFDMSFTDICEDCNGRGKIEVRKDGKIVEEFCPTCDGTGTHEEYEDFQRRHARHKKDFDDEDE